MKSNIVNDYIRSHMKHDKKNTIFIFVTITMAAILISSLSLIFYAQHDSIVQYILEFAGDFHFTFNYPLSSDDVYYIANHPEVAEFITTPTDEGMLIVKVRLKNIRDIYPISEEMCEILNIPRNIYERYPIQYNRDLLGILGIRDPYSTKTPALEQLMQTFMPVILLVAALFVIIIYNIIVMTENRRIKELGLLKSVGMSPRQIRSLIIRESLTYCIIAAPIGLIIGYILQTIVNHFKFSIVISVACVGLLVLTVVAASFIPAHRMAKLSVIEGIKGKEYSYAKKNIKTKNNTIFSRMFGIDGAIASNNFKFYKNMFRTTLIAFSLFLTIVFAFQSFLTLWLTHTTEYINSQYYDTTAYIYGDMKDNPTMNEYLAETDNEHLAFHQQMLSCKIEYSQITEKFMSDGGFNTKLTSDLTETDNGWLEAVYLLGMDDKSFDNYCNEIGVGKVELSNNEAILVNNNQGGFGENAQNYLPWDISVGDTFRIDGRSEFGMANDEYCDVTVKYMTDVYPNLKQIPFAYEIYVIVTEDIYYSLLDELKIDLMDDFFQINMTSGVDDEFLTALQSHENYYLETREDQLTQLKTDYKSMSNLIMTLIMIFGTVGICSAYSTVTGSFNVRGKDFALLRSQGIESNRLKKILYLESVILCTIPFVIALPITILANIPLFKLFTYADLPSVMMNLSYVTIVICVVLCVFSVLISYFVNIRRIFKSNIVEQIKI
jgi:ABC-type transport system, involved in lipoprotein release, permease component